MVKINRLIFLVLVTLCSFSICAASSSELLFKGKEGFYQGDKKLEDKRKNSSVVNDILELKKDSQVVVKLSEPLPLPSGHIKLEFSPAASLKDNKEHCLLDLATKGNGLRIWVTRTGLLAFDLRSRWKGVFWNNIDAEMFKVGNKYTIIFSYSPKNIEIYLNGKRILKKDKVSLPKRFSGEMCMGSWVSGKGDFQGSIFTLSIKPGPYVPAKKKSENHSTYVKPKRRKICPSLGLNIHTRYSPRELPVLARSGADFVRFHYSWKEVEQEKGIFRLPPSAYEFMDQVRKKKLDLLMILAYGNKFYDKKGSKPGFGEHHGQNENFALAFGRYCAWMVKTFGSKGRGQVKYWEVWNEENEAPASDFMPVLKAASENIRANDPEAYIVFGGISRMDYNFLRECLEAGAAKYVDAIAFHPYRESTFPEDTFQSERRFKGKVACYADEINKFRELMKQYSSPGKEIPLWITEFGYWTTDSELHLNPANSLNHDVQAKYLLRSIIQNMALGIDKYFIYRAVDSSFFGLTYGPRYLPRPAYFSLQFFLSKFPQDKELEVLDCNIKLSLNKTQLQKLKRAFPVFDPHAYAFKIDPETVLLFYWNAGPGRDIYSDTDIALANMDVALPLEEDEVEQYDLFYGSSRKSYNNGDWKARVTAKNGGVRIEGLKYYDSPVMLKLKVKK